MEKKCPKCSNSMVMGMLRSKIMTSNAPLFWLEKISFLKGSINKHEIAAFRCQSCGFLENYAI
jgi:hypothetical protein